MFKDPIRLLLISSFLCAGFFLSTNLNGLSPSDPGLFIRRIDAHLLLKDISSAQAEAETALSIFPDSQAVLKAYIQVLAVAGEETEMLKMWGQYLSKFPDQKSDRDLIEKMAWGSWIKVQNPLRSSLAS